jgi:hypothetical protein
MTAFQWIELAAWAVAVAFVGGLAAIVLYKIAIDKINLQYVISESDGDASMSRFQLLIFTFVIAMSLFLVTVGGRDDTHHRPAFPETIPAGVLTLLGISASSYLVSKGIQASTENQPTVTVSPGAASVRYGASQQFTAVIANLASGKVTWSVSPANGGTITATGLFTAPPATAQPPETVVVKATSAEDDTVSGTATVTITA